MADSGTMNSNMIHSGVPIQMKRLSVFISLLAVSVVFASAQAQSLPEPEFKAGVHYQIINPPQPTNDASKIEVVEVFSYVCPHCRNFQPFIEPWSKNVADDVLFRRQPAVFGRPQWATLARAYYTVEALGNIEEAHQAVFDALHVQRKNLTTDDALAEFFTDYGISREDYLKTANSFAIETKVKRGITLTKNYGVRGTPSIIVNGKYITTGTMAGTLPKTMEVVDFLVNLERSNSAASETSESSTGD